MFQLYLQPKMLKRKYLRRIFCINFKFKVHFKQLILIFDENIHFKYHSIYPILAETLVTDFIRKIFDFKFIGEVSEIKKTPLINLGYIFPIRFNKFMIEKHMID